jgi:NitT/TauT family transport system ATP-binding protein
VTHSINEAIRVGNRIALLSSHPGQIKAEINSPSDERRVRELLFGESADA